MLEIDNRVLACGPESVTAKSEELAWQSSPESDRAPSPLVFTKSANFTVQSSIPARSHKGGRMYKSLPCPLSEAFTITIGN